MRIMMMIMMLPLTTTLRFLAFQRGLSLHVSMYNSMLAHVTMDCVVKLNGSLMLVYVVQVNAVLMRVQP
jgi:hypothetical protein